MSNSENEIKNLEFLVVKSRELLQEQLKAYENYTSKSGILISVSSLFIPFAISFTTTNEVENKIKIISIFPVLLMIYSLFILLKVLKPKGLDHGFNSEQFENLIPKKHTEVLLFEIGANKSSFRDNNSIVAEQSKNFKKGEKYIMISSISLILLTIINSFSTNTELKNININNLKISKMMISDKEENQGNQQQSSEQGSSQRIPEVDSSQRANIEKGENPTTITKKE